MLVSTRLAFIAVQFLALISSSLANAGLAQTELRTEYGQDGTSYNDGKSCHRDCNGAPQTCYYKFNAQYYDTMNSLCGDCSKGKLKDCFNDGCITGSGIERAIMTINQQMPGPSISVCKGDRVVVDVKNQMPGQGLTIHWHGIHQHKTPWFDGVPMVTQCAINVGNTFRYAFDATDVGTHFWHAHSGFHRTNGIVGSIVVREENDPNANLYDYDLAEHEILITGWDDHIAEDKTPGMQSVPSLPNSVLINGFGSYFNSLTNVYKFAPIAVFYVKRGKRYRFRIANVASHICPFETSVMGLNLTVIASDGYSVEAFETGKLVSLPGERYDVVIDATAVLPNIKDTLLTVRSRGTCIPTKVQEFARIIFVDDISEHRQKDEDHLPPSTRPLYDVMNELFRSKITLNDPFTDCLDANSPCVAKLQQKKSISTNLRNVKPFKTIPLHFKMVGIEERPPSYLDVMNGAKIATINRIAYTSLPVPALVQDDSNVRYCNADHLPKKNGTALDNKHVYHCPHLIPLKLNKVYDFLLIDDNTGDFVSHPIHMHGYAFQVLDMGTLDQLESGKTAFREATHRPVIKDTVTIPRNGFVRIRLKTNNAGYWLFHCHIEYHMAPGMVLLFKVGNKRDMPSPPPNFPKCEDYLMPINM